MAEQIKNYLEQLLGIHWLRPETALWRCFDCLLMERYGQISGDSIDLGCGDGTMSYIMAGGQLVNYDVCQEVANINQYKQGADIYNIETNYIPQTDDSRLRYSHSYGVDHKDALVAKASRLQQFYLNTKSLDLNFTLPFEAERFQSAFSNILYWLEDIDSVLSGWHKVLRPDGRLMLFVPNENFKEKAWLYYKAPHYGDQRYLNYFDRGYSPLIKHYYSADKWIESFNRSNFRVVHHTPYLSKPVMDIWNIGTRPIAPLLLNMVQKLNHDDRQTIKHEWIDYFTKFFVPIIEGEMAVNKPTEPAFHFFILERD